MGHDAAHQLLNVERFLQNPDTSFDMNGYLEAIRPPGDEDEWKCSQFAGSFANKS